MAAGMLLIGYDVESPEPEITETFLRKVAEVHEDLEMPATLFVVGRTLAAGLEAFRAVAQHPLFDLQQHTYYHTLLKTVCMEANGEVKLVRGGTPEQIREEVSRTNQLLRDELGVECTGLTGPWGYYRGLSDRPDILEILHEAGIRFTRTYARNEKDYQPVSFDIQPFWYNVQGFPDVLEIPVQEWQDVHLREKFGWEDVRSYVAHLKRDCQEVAQRGCVWSYGTHDWSSLKGDSEMGAVRALLTEARALGMEVLSHRTYYEQCASRQAMTDEAANGNRVEVSLTPGGTEIRTLSIRRMNT